MRAYTVLLALMLAASSTSASERIYTWVDSQGTRHFSQNPPPEGVEFEERDVRSATPPPAAAMPNPTSTATGPGAMAPADAERRCRTARDRLALLTDTTRTVGYDRDGNGEPEPMSDDEKKAEIDRARAEEALACPQVPIT